jgi:hypothetical protein
MQALKEAGRIFKAGRTLILSYRVETSAKSRLVILSTAKDLVFPGTYSVCQKFFPISVF